MRLPGRADRIGVAVAPEGLTGVLEGSAARPERVEVAGAGAGGEALEEAFRELSARLETTHGRSLDGAEVAVALLPPLADTRLLSLPPLRREEMEAVVRRDAARHFLGVEGPRVVGVAAGPGGTSGPVPVLAAAAPTPFMEDVRRAVSAAGWRLNSVVPAAAAWGAAGPRGRDAHGLMVAVERGTAHVLHLEEGAPVSYRRVSLDLPDALADATGTGRGPAVVVSDPSGAGTVADVVKRGGWELAPTSGRRPTAAEAAARHARAATLELVPPTLAADRTDRRRRTVLRMGGLAALLMVAAGGVHLWGAARELEVVRAERAEIREEVAPLVAARDSLDALEARMATIDDITGRSPRWTRALYELALLLPRDAHLTSLVADEESLEIEAEAARAGAAIQALRGAESLRDVQLLGLVERELREGATVVERFRLEARLAPPGDPSGGTPGTTEGRGRPDGGSAGHSGPETGAPARPAPVPGPSGEADLDAGAAGGAGSDTGAVGDGGRDGGSGERRPGGGRRQGGPP